MEMVNGYVFLDLTKTNVYSKALKVLGTDKPVVIKDGSGSPYFVDSLTLDGTNIIITKGGKTITIANDNTITNVGDIQNHLYEYLIQIKCTNNNYFFTKILNTNKYLGEYDISSELFNFLDELNCFEKYVCENDGNEYCAVIYQVDDSDTFELDVRIFGEGHISNVSETITKVQFTLIQQLF